MIFAEELLVEPSNIISNWLNKKLLALLLISFHLQIVSYKAFESDFDEKTIFDQYHKSESLSRLKIDPIKFWMKMVNIEGNHPKSSCTKACTFATCPYTNIVYNARTLH